MAKILWKLLYIGYGVTLSQALCLNVTQRKGGSTAAAPPQTSFRYIFLLGVDTGVRIHDQQSTFSSTKCLRIFTIAMPHANGYPKFINWWQS